MAQTKLATRDGNEYVAAVRHQLADVPWRRRKELLGAVRESVDELPVNAMASVRLGPPRAFARELRESAGLPPRSRKPLALVRGARPRTLILAVASVIVVAALIAAGVYRAHYQPLSVNAYFGYSNAAVIDEPFVTDTNFYRYTPGKIVVSGMDVHNSGWATVTVDNAVLPSNLLKVREIRATTNQYIGGLWERAAKVDHVSVAPGQTVTVFVVMEVADFGTIGPGSYVSTQQPKLRTHVLGIEHTIPIRASDIAMVGPDQ